MEEKKKPKKNWKKLKDSILSYKMIAFFRMCNAVHFHWVYCVKKPFITTNKIITSFSSIKFDISLAYIVLHMKQSRTLSFALFPFRHELNSLKEKNSKWIPLCCCNLIFLVLVSVVMHFHGSLLIPCIKHEYNACSDCVSLNKIVHNKIIN